MRLLTLRSGTYFPMGDGKNWRVISPDIGAQDITLNFGIHAPGQEFSQHVHDRSEDLIVCLSGGTSLRQGDTYRPIRAGDAAWIPAGEVHGTKNTTDAEALLFSFQSPPDMALYRGERDTMRGAAAPNPFLGSTNAAQIRTMCEAPRLPEKSGTWNTVFSANTGSRSAALDHIALAPGESAAFMSGSREGVLVVTAGSATVGDPSRRLLEREGVVLLGPGDGELRVRAGDVGARMVFARSIIL